MSDIEELPPTAAQPSVCQDTVERMLNGLAVVGRIFRGAYTTSSTCVRRAAYSVKESVVQQWDHCMGKWDTAAGRPGKAPEGVVYFSDRGDSDSDASGSSTQSTESSSRYLGGLDLFEWLQRLEHYQLTRIHRSTEAAASQHESQGQLVEMMRNKLFQTLGREKTLGVMYHFHRFCEVKT